MNVQKVKVNLVPGGIVPVANLSQGDYGRIIQFEMYDGDSPADLSNVTTCFLSGKKPDNKAFTLTGTILNNTVTVESTYQSTVLSGQLEAKLIFIDDNDQIKSALLVWDVEYDPSAGAVVSDEDVQDAISAVLAIKAEVEQDAANAGASALAAAEFEENAAESEENAATSQSNAEAWAIGMRNGVPVESTDETYHNNSKYYSEQSETSSVISGSSMRMAGGYAAAAENSAIVSGSSMRIAGNYASDSEAYSIGKRNGADVPSTDPAYHNNAKYYAEIASQYAQGGLIYKGSILFANIPTSGMVNGDEYNIEDDFVTDSRFQEGAGVSVAAGTNIAWNGSKWDVFSTGGGVNYLTVENGKVCAVYEE